ETRETAASSARETARDAEAKLATKERELQLLAERRAEVASALASAEARIAEHEQAIEANGKVLQDKEQELAVLLALDEQHSSALQSLHMERSGLEKEKFELRAK